MIHGKTIITVIVRHIEIVTIDIVIEILIDRIEEDTTTIDHRRIIEIVRDRRMIVIAIDRHVKIVRIEADAVVVVVVEISTVVVEAIIIIEIVKDIKRIIHNRGKTVEEEDVVDLVVEAVFKSINVKSDLIDRMNSYHQIIIIIRSIETVDRISMDHHLNIGLFKRIFRMETSNPWAGDRPDTIVQISILQMQIILPINSRIHVLAVDQVVSVIDKTNTKTTDR